MSEWVDFREIKEQVRLVDVIRRYGIELRMSGPGCLRGRCPLPTHDPTDSVPSFSINTAKNIWACHSQSCIAKRGVIIGGNVLDFVTVMEGCTIRDSALLLQRWFLGAAQSYQPAMKERMVPAPAPGNRALGFRLFGIDPSHPYIAKRGISLATARLFGVGYYSGRGILSHRVVIPIHNQSGELIAYAGRSVEGEEPRYRFPPGFRKAAELFNLHRVAHDGKYGRVLLVEGFFDCMKVHQAGYSGVVALMGCGLSHQQARLLAEHFQEVVLLLDGDEAGRLASESIADRLSSTLKVYRGRIPPGRQPDELAQDELQATMEGAVS